METAISASTKPLAAKYSEQQRRAWVRQWQDSGLSQQQFCREHGLNVNTFNYRKRRLLDKREATGVKSNKTKRPAFVKINAKEVTDVDVSLSLPNGCRLSWRGEVCPTYLKALLAVLIP